MKILKFILPCCYVGMMIGFAICSVIAFKKELNIAGISLLIGTAIMTAFSSDAISKEIKNENESKQT